MKKRWMLASAALTILLAGGCASSQDREDAEESRQSRNTQETDGGDRSGLLIPPAELRGAYPILLRNVSAKYRYSAK